MHVEQPKFEIVSIGPCKYRKLVLTDFCPVAKQKRQCHDEDVEEEEDRCDIPLDYEGSEYVYRMEVLQIYMKFVIGKGGRTKQRIEKDSGATIVIPETGAKDKRVVIKSASKYDIYAAVAQIELLLEKEEDRMDFTHYFALPLQMETFTAFKEEVLTQQYPTFGPSLFQRPNKLHFTLCMIRIHSEEQQKKAFIVLNECEEKLRQASLVAHCVGLHYMNDDPKTVDVVYTTDTSADLLIKLNSLLDDLYNMLISNGLISENSLHKQRLLSTQKTAEIKLHATLLNSKWWPDGSMDVRECMKKFHDFDFGKIPLEKVNLIDLKTSLPVLPV